VQHAPYTHVHLLHPKSAPLSLLPPPLLPPPSSAHHPTRADPPTPRPAGHDPRRASRLQQGPGRRHPGGDPPPLRQQGELVVLLLALRNARQGALVEPAPCVLVDVQAATHARSARRSSPTSACASRSSTSSRRPRAPSCTATAASTTAVRPPLTSITRALPCADAGPAGEFRLIIFRPYIGEALVGKVKSQSPEGIVGPSPLSLSSPCSNDGLER